MSIVDHSKREAVQYLLYSTVLGTVGALLDMYVSQLADSLN